MDVSGAAVPSVVRNRVGCSRNTLIWEAMDPAISVPKNTVMICGAHRVVRTLTLGTLDSKRSAALCIAARDQRAEQHGDDLRRTPRGQSPKP